MENTETKFQSTLDRAFVSFLRLDGEKLAWIVLLVVALLTRTIGLGDRVMSHDESLHTVYSFQLYDGRGYQHQPMMHGPLKFVLNPVMYFLFGVNDWSARIQVALFGVAMVGFVWLLRRWLGKIGAFLAAAMYAISPALLYHSRYIRDEVMLTSLLVFLVVAMFRYLDTRARKWLVWTAVALGLAFLTMEASFIFGGIFGIFLVLALAAQLWAAAWPGERAGPAQLVPHPGGVALPLLAVGLVLVIFKLKVRGHHPAGSGRGAGAAGRGPGDRGVAQEAAHLRRAGPDRAAAYPGDAFPVGRRPEGAGLADQPVQQPRPDHPDQMSGRAAWCWSPVHHQCCDRAISGCADAG